MQNDKSKFKKEFKKRLYNFALKLIEFLDRLPKDTVSKRIGDQLLRSGRASLQTILKDSQPAARKILQTFSIRL